jgi:hypothetical protein
VCRVPKEAGVRSPHDRDFRELRPVARVEEVPDEADGENETRTVAGSGLASVAVSPGVSA